MGNLKIFPNMDSEEFLAYYEKCRLMIGNSSAGIREAPSFKLPVINIGTRQNGRLRAGNVIDVDYEWKRLLVNAIKVAFG